jgi:hypothetical protein
LKDLLWERWVVGVARVWLRGWVLGLLVLAVLAVLAVLPLKVREPGLAVLVEPGQVRAKLLAKLWLPPLQ